GRHRAALRGARRRHHLHVRPRPVLGHQPAAVVLLDRPPARRCGHAAAQRRAGRAVASVATLPRLAIVTTVASPAAAQASSGTARPVLSTHGLNKSFGSLVVARDVNLSLPRGARHALIGPNGAGKTTL